MLYAEGAGVLAHVNCVVVFNLSEERQAENNLPPAVKNKYLAAPQTGFGPSLLLTTKQIKKENILIL